MPAKKLKEFLDQHHIKYLTISHSPAFTAQQVAESAHISGKEIAKIVIVKLDDKLTMIVLPSTSKIDLDQLKESTHAKKAELASEYEFKDKFPECELGAMPPFGSLFGMEVFVVKGLGNNKQIAFNAGSHSELFQMTYDDFIRLESPKVL